MCVLAPHPLPLIGINETEVERKIEFSSRSSLSFFFAAFFFVGPVDGVENRGSGCRVIL